MLGHACFAGYLIRARLNKTLYSPRLLSYFSNSSSYWSWLNSITIQATIQNVSAEKYNSLLLPLPPLDEQRAIVVYLDEQTAIIDTLIGKARRAIDLLGEHRAALISAAVTGQIDVRAVASEEPA